MHGVRSIITMQAPWQGHENFQTDMSKEIRRD